MNKCLVITLALLPMIGSAQEKSTRPTCCPTPPNTPGPTVASFSMNPATYSMGDLAVHPTKTIVKEERDGYLLHVEVTNEMGNNCSSPCGKVIVLLPTETKVISVQGATGWRQCFGNLEVDIPKKICPKRGSTLTPGPTDDWSYVFGFDVKIGYSGHGLGKCNPTLGVFARSESPDPEPQNNYWWWYRKCPPSGSDPDPAIWGPKP